MRANIDFAKAREDAAEMVSLVGMLRRDRPILLTLFVASPSEKAYGTPDQLDEHIQELSKRTLRVLSLAEQVNVPDATRQELEAYRARSLALESLCREAKEELASLIAQRDATRRFQEALATPSAFVDKHGRLLHASIADLEIELARLSGELVGAKRAADGYAVSLRAVVAAVRAVEELERASAVCDRLVQFIARETSFAEGIARIERAENAAAAAREREIRLRERNAAVDERRRRRFTGGSQAESETATDSAGQSTADPLEVGRSATAPAHLPTDGHTKANESSNSQWTDESERFIRKGRPWI